MFRKRGGRGGSARGRGSGQAPEARGLFENNAWLCDCAPRLPAEHFRVKKEGPNKGRWFYTCQRDQAERCGFFLWDDDAEPRMQAALLGRLNETSAASITADPHGAVRESPPSAQPAARRTPPPPYTAVPQPRQGLQAPITPSRKRSRSASDEDDDDDDYGSGPELLSRARPSRVATSADAATISPPVTPRKAVKTLDAASPSAGRGVSGAAGTTRVEYGLTTPTTVSRDGGRAGMLVDVAAAAGQGAPTPTKPGEDITAAVFAHLDATHTPLKPEAAAGLRALLDAHGQRVRGLTRGRDVAREAIRTRDARIGVLAARVADLEADLALYRATVRSSQQQSGGGGGGGGA